ncbi:Zinc finger, CW-type [Artemisia annua]|uniref:Zinc finger, CW-type n=1 Tax=Artemisia annua TaxID=35608 RepID=A0A2U1Q0A5_ARTAN|nr:Zinc finger, CW-type [Artemisia annua]
MSYSLTVRFFSLILQQMMTSFPVLGGLLSPLPYDLLCLTEKEKREDSSCGSVYKQSQETPFTVKKSESKVDRNIFSEKKPKIENNIASVEARKKEAVNDNLSCGDISNALKLPFLSDTHDNVLDFRKGTTLKGEPSVVPKEESQDPVSTHDDFRVEKPYKKNGNVNSDEKHSGFPIKSGSDVSKGGSKIHDTELVKPLKQKAAHKATSHEKDNMKLATSSSGGKKKSKGSQSLENGIQSVEVPKAGFKSESSSKNKNNTHGSKVDDLKNNGKVRETYKDFFGELYPEHEDDEDMAVEEKPFIDRPKDCNVAEKGSLESNVSSKESKIRKKGPKPSSLVYPGVGPGPTQQLVSASGNGLPVLDAASAAGEDLWVCCDRCEKWRLLPPGLNPGNLPEKWLCSMLDWLPGMNRCSIDQDETTKAVTIQYLVPASAIQGLQPVHPGGPPFSVELPYPDQRHQPFGPQAGVKKKHGTKDRSHEPKQERPSLSSNSTKKNLHTSNKTRSLNGANQSPLVNEVEFQDSGQSISLAAEKHRLKHKEKKKLRDKVVDEGNNALQLKIRNKRETSQDYSRDSKKVKTDNNHGTDKERSSDHDLPPRKDHLKYDERPKDSSSVSKVINPKHQNGTFDTVKSEEKDSVRKRKSNEFDDAQIEETSETGQRKGKKVKVPEFQEEDKGRLLAANSSSSKVSGSHKNKVNLETKGSPVESVSSSPLRILNPEKLASSRRNIEGVDNYQDPVTLKKEWEDDRGSYRSNSFKKDLGVVESLDKGLGHLPSKGGIVASVEFETLGTKSSFIGHNGEKKKDHQSHSSGSRARKSGKGSSSRSKDKHRSSKSDNEKINLKVSERMNENRSQDKPSSNPDKFGKGSASKKESSGKPVSIQDVKQNVKMETDGERSSKRDVSERGKPHSLPPSGKGQNETLRPPQHSLKENKGNKLSVDGVDMADVSKTPKQKKKGENLNGNQSVSVRHPTPNTHRGTPSPLRRESSNQAASAIKEAKALKHMADRLKNNGSNHESNSLYFQAALKFLYGSSILESSYIESGKHGDIAQSMTMYSSTAKLCEYVAHEYEKSKEMAAAALSYKLAEVAYLKVVYSSHTGASKDRQELQTALQLGPTGESPSSSASDIDNLNNPAAVDKAVLAKGVNDPQIGGNHVIAARNKPNFLRILNFAQDVNLAMEASRRSQIALAASASQPEHAHQKEVIKPALDFNFQDVEGLLQIVRVAMEVISR